MFWTNERHLELISQSLVGGDGGPLPLGPSSSIVIEFFDSSQKNDLSVEIYVNDQAVSSQFCGGEQTCSASAFVSALTASIGDQDVAKVCETSQ